MRGDGGSTPHQYSIPSDAKELQDLIEYRNMNFAIGNIFKACYRMGRKEGADELYDLNKIIFFAEREKKRIKREEARAKLYAIKEEGAQTIRWPFDEGI